MLRPLPGMSLCLDPTAYLAENATLVGAVTVGPLASVWYGAVLRGDSGTIRLGPRCAVQDNVTIHGETVLEEDVVVGHNAVLHTCRIGKGSLIGMNATVMNGAQIGEGCLVAAGCLVPQNAVIPPHSLVMGIPGRVVRPLTEEQRQNVASSAAHYVRLAQLQLPQHGSQT